MNRTLGRAAAPTGDDAQRPAPWRWQRLRRRALPYGLVAPGMLLLLLLFGVPTVYNVALSFQRITPYDAVGGGEWIGWRNYVDVITSPLTATSAVNTVVWLTLVTVIVRLVAGLGIALLLSSDVLRRYKVTGVARTAVLIPWMIPPTVAVAAWKWLLDGRAGIINRILQDLGVIDAPIAFLADTSTVWPSIAAILVWRELPFVVIVMIAGLAGISREQYEAASIDGAGWWRTLGSITLPNLRPVLGVITLMITIGSFNNFIYVWLSTGGGPGTFTQVLATQLYSYGFIDNDLGRGAAVGMLMTAVMAIFALAYLAMLQRKDPS